MGSMCCEAYILYLVLSDLIEHFRINKKYFSMFRENNFLAKKIDENFFYVKFLNKYSTRPFIFIFITGSLRWPYGH